MGIGHLGIGQCLIMFVRDRYKPRPPRWPILKWYYGCVGACISGVMSWSYKLTHNTSY